MRTQLSSWIGNHRITLKKQGKKRNAETNINHVSKMSKVEISNETYVLNNSTDNKYLLD